MKIIGIILLTMLSLFVGVNWTEAGPTESTGFTYNGRLNDGTNPANGSYDFKVALFAQNKNGSAIAGPFTYSPIGVTNGLFVLIVDFGDQFPGADRWLEISVRTNGNPTFNLLTPRQLLTPTPYAIHAADAAQVGGQSPEAFVAKTGDTITGSLNVNGALVVDASGLNNGTVNPGLSFGGVGSGEGIASKRSVGGGNQWGLDLYTANIARLSIGNSGNVGIGTTTATARLEIQAGADHTGANDPRAIALAYRNGGFRHWISSRHNSGAPDNGIDFYLNTNSISGGSTAPGIGNKKVMVLDSANGIQAIGGLVIENRTSDPASPATGQIWIRTDL